MIKLNKNGFTLVEIIIASTMALVVAGFLIAITIKMVNKNNDYYIESQLLADKNVITKEIMDDLNNPELKLKSITQLNPQHIIYTFENVNNGETLQPKPLIVTKEDPDDLASPTIVQYGEFKKKLGAEGSINEIVATENPSPDNNPNLQIELPIYTNYSDEDYGIEITIPDINEVDVTIPDFENNETLCENVVKNKLGLGSVLNTTNITNISKSSCSVGCEENTSGIFTTEDDTGTACYFRGSVTNNYVKFAGYYWRILRVNGDGTIRMIFEKTVSNNNYFIAYTNYNSESRNNTAVGYMHNGSTDVSGKTSTYNATHVNEENSTIKTAIDNWYKNNLSNYSSYIADAIYCNDRSLASASTGNGSDFGPYINYYGFSGRYNTPVLTCENVNDRFTMENSQIVTTDGLGTNRNLRYPVALITADEVLFAGASKRGGGTNFLIKDSYSFWTMTPYLKKNGEMKAQIIYCDSNISGDSIYNNETTLAYLSASSDFGIRPVISLKTDGMKFTGNGTLNDPFIISKM